LRNV